MQRVNAPPTLTHAAVAAGAGRHRIPAIDRFMEVLRVLERRPEGATISELSAALRLPRTSVYRILNSAQTHAVVRRAMQGAYVLGPRLIALAARVPGAAGHAALVSLAAPLMARLSEEIGEASKLSVLEDDMALVVAASSSRREFALTVAVGQMLPLHAGAAGKVLLAHLPADRRDALLAAPLTAYTDATVTDARRLNAELARIRRASLAEDRGEYMSSVRAFAAPVRDARDEVVAALSVPFLIGANRQRSGRIRTAVAATAEAISVALRQDRLRNSNPT
jgi:DNA-binding IclR family transcriptional regulator